RRRRRIADEANGKLVRYEARGRRAGGEHMQHFESLVLAAFMDHRAKDSLRAGLVAALLKLVITSAQRLDGPPSEDLRYLRNVGLRITAVDAESMQLHQLAGVVF